MTASGEVHTDVDGKRWLDTGRGWRALDEEPSSNGHVVQARRTSWSAPDLVSAEFADPTFAVPELIPEGLAFMCGAPKLGKSWLAPRTGHRLFE